MDSQIEGTDEVGEVGGTALMVVLLLQHSEHNATALTGIF